MNRSILEAKRRDILIAIMPNIAGFMNGASAESRKSAQKMVQIVSSVLQVEIDFIIIIIII